MSKCKKCLLTLLCTLICLFNALPLSAFAAQPDLTFSAPFSEPYVGDNSFYVEVLFQSKSDPSVFNVHVYSFQYFVEFDSQPSSSVDIYNVVTPKLQTALSLSTGASVFVFFSETLDHIVEGFYTVVDYSLNYNKYYVHPSYSLDDQFIIKDDSSWSIVGINFKGINLTKLDFALSYSFLVNYSNSDNSSAKIQEIINQLYILVGNDETKIQALNDMLEDFNTLLANTDEIENQLDVANKFLEFIRDYVLIYLPNIEQVLWYIDDDIMLVQEKLDVIIDLLQPDTDINISTVDPSNFDEYNKAEQSLLDNSNVDVSGALKVEVDQNALLFIWPLVENCLNTHPQVIGLVFTILSISIVALVLGRKGG